MNGIRLQLLLAKAGVASRRRAEELIVAQRVAVNGRIVDELGTKVDPVLDRVTVDGKPVEREAPAYYLLNKPKGYVTTASDPEGRTTVFELLPKTLVRLFSVGRLDYNTEGALLLTNDGELAHALMHPSRGVPKVYHAKLRGLVSADQVRRLRDGVVLPPPRPPDREGRLVPLPTRGHGARGQGANEPPERSAPAQVDVLTSTGKHSWLQVVLHEGKNRQIHRMAEAVGSSLLKLIRVAYAGLELGDLAAGSYRPLRPREIIQLRQSVGLPGRVPGAPEEEAPSRGARPGRSPSAASGQRSGAKAGPKAGPRPDRKPYSTRGPAREDDRPRSAPPRSPQRDRASTGWEGAWDRDREPERRGSQGPQRAGAPMRARPERPTQRWDEPPRRAPSGAGRAAPEARGGSRGGSRQPPQPRPPARPHSRPHPRHDDDRPSR